MLEYFSGVAREFKYIRWLSFRRVVVLTTIVIIVALVGGFVIGAFDSIFANVLKDVV